MQIIVNLTLIMSPSPVSNAGVHPADSDQVLDTLQVPLTAGQVQGGPGDQIIGNVYSISLSRICIIFEEILVVKYEITFDTSSHPVEHPPVVVVCTVHVTAAVEGLLQGLDVALACRHQQPQDLDTFPLVLVFPGRVLPTSTRHVRGQLGVKGVKTVHLDKLLAKPEQSI